MKRNSFGMVIPYIRLYIIIYSEENVNEQFKNIFKGGIQMPKNSVRSTAKVASKASKALRNNGTSKTTKTLAGSVLSNRKPK